MRLHRGRQLHQPWSRSEVLGETLGRRPSRDNFSVVESEEGRAGLHRKCQRFQKGVRRRGRNYGGIRLGGRIQPVDRPLRKSDPLEEEVPFFRGWAIPEKVPEVSETRGRAAGGITAVFGSAGPLKCVDRCSGKQLTLRKSRREGGLAILRRLLPSVSIGRTVLSPSRLVETGEPRQVEGQGCASPTTAARKDRRSQMAGQAETSPVGTWLSGLPP
jgi:hypothetical protein